MVKKGSATKSPDTVNVKHFIAKTPTQQPEFLSEYPEFDGRGVVIGIIDSCIDLSLPGLQKTSTGLPKIIDCFDLTGNGNVNTSTIKKIENEENVLIGLTGRKLKIPSTWKNPTGEWHLGIKSIYELCDEQALSYITESRRARIKEKNEKLKKESENIQNEEDHNFMLKYLKETEKLSKDSLVADCIVWNDGKQWQACLDTSFLGNLENVKVMTNFRDCHEHGLLFDKLSYCFNIRENGNLLEIYATNDDHGTVIANVCAGYYPDEPEKNGLAPGAQIISFSIMDPKKNGYANYQGIIRAFHKCLELDIDIINLSMGSISEQEYFWLEELAIKNNILIIKAAGNTGPINSSIYEMGHLHNLVLNIGSCLTSEMKKNLFKIDTKDPLNVSSFSSRGPMPKSGASGISLLAPGHGAVHMPRHYPCETKLFEGTSISAPNATGAISCLISGLKSKLTPITFFKIKLALINTAFLPRNESKLAFGNGIIQIKDAFEFYCKNLSNFPSQITIISTFLVQKQSIFNYFWKENEKNGILLKVVDKNLNYYNYCVKINISSTEELVPKINWTLKLSSNSETFIKEFSAVDQNNTFSLSIDISELKENSINYAEISGFDSLNPFWGPLFHFPITVIIPKNLNETEKMNETIELNSTSPYRLFIPPFSSKIYEIRFKLTCLEENVKKEFGIKIQVGFGQEMMLDQGEFTKLKINETINVQSWEFEVLNPNEIHEICIILDEIKIVKNLKFKFELSFVEKPSIFSKIRSKVQAFFERFHEDDETHYDEDENDFGGASTSTSLSTIYFDDERIHYLYCQKVKFQNIGAKKYFIATYYFTVTKKTKCEFFDSCLRTQSSFKTHKILVFTQSKKFVVGYIQFLSKKVTLHPGTYVVKGIFEYFDDGIKQSILPFFFHLPVITFKPDDENVIKTFWSNSNDAAQDYANLLKALVGSIVPLKISMKNYSNNVNPKDAQIWHENIQKYYRNHDHQNVTKAADLFLQKINAKQFLNDYNKIENNANFYEKEMLKIQRSQILDVLFFKADSILNENLKNCKNISSIFKNNFGFNLIFNNLETKMKKMYPTIFDILWSLFTYNVYPNQKPKQLSCSKIPYQNSNNHEMDSNNYYLPHFETTIIRKNVKNVTSLFLKFADDSDIRKSLIIIKKALIFGKFGTALFYLNKTSKENQTIPIYKIFDEGIIQILKQLDWSHVIEAHENALLDRYRNFYRSF